MLGVELVRDEYHIGKKALAKLVAGGLPRTLSKLQAVWDGSSFARSLSLNIVVVSNHCKSYLLKPQMAGGHRLTHRR